MNYGISEENPEKKQYFDSNLQYNAYLATPDSKDIFPELNKDISLSDLDSKKQKVILIKSRVADYIRQTFAKCPILVGYDEKKTPIFAQDENQQPIFYNASSYMSFIRDVMAMSITSQALKARLLRQLTENNSSISHTYDMSDKYKKNIGG